MITFVPFHDHCDIFHDFVTVHTITSTHSMTVVIHFMITFSTLYDNNNYKITIITLINNNHRHTITSQETRTNFQQNIFLNNHREKCERSLRNQPLERLSLNKTLTRSTLNNNPFSSALV